MTTHAVSTSTHPVKTAGSSSVVASPRPYVDPYAAGIALGLVLLAAFVIMGRGLGASGAFSTLVSVGVANVAPEHARGNAFYADNLGGLESNPLKDWLLFEVIGVVAGGFLSGVLAGRIKLVTERGPRITDRSRLLLALLGGGLMGFGAKLARGCTSGQALTGGALLNVGSWAFMMAVFAGAYLLAYFVRRQWQ